MGEDKKPKLVDGDFPIYKSKYDSCDLDETFVDCVTSRLNNDGLTSISQPVTTQMKATTDYRYSTGSSYCEYIMDGKTDVYESTHDENYKIVYDKEECTNLGGKYIENVKNYVLFDNQLYRVIGVFETKENETSDYKYKVKLIKDFPLTKDVLGLENLHPYTTEYVWYYYLFQRDFDFYKFDTKNTNGDGYFPTSFINNKLNNEYLSSLDDQSKNMIDDNLWYLGGALNNLLFPDGFYQQERSNNVYSTNSINYVSKIGLPYVSDIGYASDPDYWNGENLRICREFENSWIVNGSEDFTITPNIVDNSHVFAYGCHYYINTCLYGVNPNGYANIRPTFYLDENVKYKSGNGTYNHPYIIEM